MVDITEHKIQDCLALEMTCRHHSMIIPNCYFFGTNELDMLSVTSAGYVWEYEIKISRADFLADSKKKRNNWYSGGLKPQMWQGKNHKPNRFWYVVPQGLLNDLDIPSYAGIMEVKTEYGYTIITKKNAPVIHKERISEAQLLEFGHKLSFRYWGMRDKIKEIELEQKFGL